MGEEGRERVQLLSDDSSSSDRLRLSLGDQVRQEVILRSSDELAGFKFEAKLVVEEESETSEY